MRNVRSTVFKLLCFCTVRNTSRKKQYCCKYNVLNRVYDTDYYLKWDHNGVIAIFKVSVIIVITWI